MGRVRCICFGISEGSCINPFQKVGGQRLFSQKNSKILNSYFRARPKELDASVFLVLRYKRIRLDHLFSSFSWFDVRLCRRLN